MKKIVTRYPLVALLVTCIFGAVSSLCSVMNRASEETKTVQSGGADPNRPSSDETDEYSVYSVVLKDDRYIDSGTTQMVIRGRSHAGLLDKNYLQREIPFISPTTVSDYESKNKTSSSLKNQLSVNRKYSLVTEREVEIIFSEGGSGWKNFYSKFPGSKGLISLSRVGFNADRTHALVHVAIGCDWTCGDGQMVFLRKENNEWKVVGKVLTSIS